MSALKAGVYRSIFHKHQNRDLPEQTKQAFTMPWWTERKNNNTHTVRWQRRKIYKTGTAGPLTHTHTHANTHHFSIYLTHTHTQTQTHTHTHTHTHTQNLVPKKYFPLHIHVLNNVNASFQNHFACNQKHKNNAGSFTIIHATVCKTSAI